MPSSISVQQLPSALYVIRLEGDFDVANAEDVTVALDTAIADPDSRTLAIDLSAVTFLDSTLLQALVTGRDRAQLAHKPVWIVRPAPVVWRVFTVTMLHKLFRDFESLEALQEYARSTATTLSPP
jgi:anti-sigma B factor antagonist